MTSLINKTHSLLSDEDAPTAAEYTVILALIVAICFGFLTSIGNKVKATFLNLESSLSEGS